MSSTFSLEKNSCKELLQSPWGLHWFRRDLRLPGNLALRKNWHKSDRRVLGIFFFDSKFLSRSDFSHNRFGFFLKTLDSLRRDLRDHGGDLLIVDKLPDEGFNQLFDWVRKQGAALPSQVSFGRDYEPFARGRDSKVSALLKNKGIEVLQERDHLLIEPEEIYKGDETGSFYQVYSPFARRWFEALATENMQKRLQSQALNLENKLTDSQKSKTFSLRWREILELPDFPFQDAFADFQDRNSPHVSIPLPDAGHEAAVMKLQNFKPKLSDYKENRDFPNLSGTSGLSMYLKNGSLVPAQILQFLDLGKTDWKSKIGDSQYAREIAWREFYYHILFHRPDIENRSFLPQYENLPWENREDYFESWKEGKTGFPIVDAGMRELHQTGWMHNRVRMIVASFLTKDLLVDWRWGENHFMKLLLDGDLACNNGGWQWAASTGCDPQPYFRIFNPWLQGVKFDEKAVYIKKYIPELRNFSADEIHDPTADLTKFGYPARIVNHAEQKEKALALFKNARPSKTS